MVTSSGITLESNPTNPLIIILVVKKKDCEKPSIQEKNVHLKTQL